MVDRIKFVTDAGIEVCAHIGYTPQTRGQATVQGKDVERARELINAARQLDAAGAGTVLFTALAKYDGRKVTVQSSRTFLRLIYSS